MISKIGNFTNFTMNLNENKVISFESNRKIIRSYIRNIKKSNQYPKGERDGYNFYNIRIEFLVILHNFLHIEEMFEKEVKLNDKQINKYIELPKTSDFNTIIKICDKYYDNNNKVKFGIETLDSIREVRDYLSKLRSNVDIYNKIQINPF